jgi:tRNA U54 and U55 pseudouridine synthase Pus10
MSLTNNQIQYIVEAYAERMVDNMDTKTMEQFVFDTIVEHMIMDNDEEIISQLSDYYDDAELAELFTEAGAVLDTEAV